MVSRIELYLESPRCGFTLAGRSDAPTRWIEASKVGILGYWDTSSNSMFYKFIKI